MAMHTCALPGCLKPASPYSMRRQGSAPPLACGNLHHQLLMARHFNPTLPSPYPRPGVCALLSCEEPPSMGHSWCSRTHYLLWLAEFTSSLHPDQICMLPGCHRHVYVDENGSASRFCGWRHQQKFVMLSARQHHQAEPPEVLMQQPPLLASVTERECRGHLPRLDTLMESLKQFALSAIPPKNINVIEDFYDKHPWEVFTEEQACWLIVRLKFTSKGRQLTTTGGYHWKQSGRPVRKGLYVEKYYTYTNTKRKGRGKEAGQQQAKISYTMKEYSIKYVKWYSLIHLVKEKPFKQQHRKQQNADQVDSMCPRGMVTMGSQGDDDDMLLSFLNDLLAPDENYSSAIDPCGSCRDGSAAT